MEFVTIQYGTRSQVETSMLEVGECIDNLEFKACFETRGRREPPEVCNWMIFREEGVVKPLVEVELIRVSTNSLRLVANNGIFIGDLAS